MPGSGVQHYEHITSAKDFDDKVKRAPAGKLVLVDFFATWCGPCMAIAPKLEEMSKEDAFKDILFFKVDIDEVESVAEDCGINAMPTFKFFKDGKEVAEVGEGFSACQLSQLYGRLPCRDSSVHDCKDFDDKVKRAPAGKLVLVDFFATWCGPCKTIAPKLEEMSKEDAFKDIIFCKVDVDEVESVAKDCGISAMPTFKFFKDGKEVAEFVGANVDKIRELLITHSK